RPSGIDPTTSVPLYAGAPEIRGNFCPASLRTTRSACPPTIDQTPALVTEAEQNEAYFGSR
ncbi:hypothetical protein ACCT24_37305, partial [Rhizobium ruizarguesonis]